MKRATTHRLQPGAAQHPQRRHLLAAGMLLAVSVRPVRAQGTGATGQVSGQLNGQLSDRLTDIPSDRLTDGLRQLVRRWSGDVLPRAGRIELEIAPLVENGNAVPITVRVDSPMTATEHVREIVVFNERNPQPEVLRCVLSPASGRAEVSARIRLATTQHLVALARMSDGSVWQHTVEVIVTLAACLE